MSEGHVEIEEAMDASSPTTIRVVGAVTLQSVETMLTDFVSAFKVSRKIDLDLSAITELDLAGMQLLCSAHRSSYTQSIEFKVTGHNPLVWEMAEASGHLRFKGCEQDINNTCVWCRGGKQL